MRMLIQSASGLTVAGILEGEGILRPLVVDINNGGSVTSDGLLSNGLGGEVLIRFHRSRSHGTGVATLGHALFVGILVIIRVLQPVDDRVADLCRRPMGVHSGVGRQGAVKGVQGSAISLCVPAAKV